MDSSPHENTSLVHTSSSARSTSVNVKKCRKVPEILCNGQETNNSRKRAKIMHREVERQRRQEMAALYSTLRSLLPREYLQGKRSLADHVNETVNYIKHKQQKIKEMIKERDELKRLSSSRTSYIKQERSGPQSNVSVHASFTGVDVILSGDNRDGGVLLSKVLAKLAKEGLGVLGFVSRRINEVTFHTIQSEIVNEEALNVSDLQRKLVDLVYLNQHV